MDLSYLKSRTIVNVEADANFGGGWIITLEDGEMIRLGGDVAMEQSLPMLRDALAELLSTEDAHEGIAAFLQKRKPVWTGR